MLMSFFVFQTCANLTEIDRLYNTGEILVEKISVSYLNEDIPVIIENVTELWPHRGIIDVKRLKEVRFILVLFQQSGFVSFNPMALRMAQTL